VNLGLDTRYTILEVLGIETVEVGEERVIATMPVTGATMQPAGILHGGAISGAGGDRGDRRDIAPDRQGKSAAGRPRDQRQSHTQ
jgi:hypothetical protein